jgi:hypothetical protein
MSTYRNPVSRRRNTLDTVGGKGRRVENRKSKVESVSLSMPRLLS